MAALLMVSGAAFAQRDTLLSEVVVTGTRTSTDVRHLPFTVNVIDRQTLTAENRINVLPTVTEHVPGVFVTSRSMMGYGVSDGAAGRINLRGLSGTAGQMLVLIDGHPQYQGIYGHPISDSYQTLMAERIEVLRGPASMLYGSNAMGGVMNIVTQAMKANGSKTHVNLGAGSYGTLQGELSNQTRYGRFTSTVAAQYSRTDNHRPRMGFEQYGGYIKLGYELSKYWNVSMDADITHFNASYPGSVTAPKYGADQWITRGVASAMLENDYGYTNGALSVYSNFGRHKIDDGTNSADKTTNYYFRSKDALTGISLYQSAQLFGGNRVTMGVDYQNIYGYAYNTSKETGEIINKGKPSYGRSYRNEIAAYIDFRQDIATWLTVDAGIRMDHHSVTGTEWIPQAGVVVRPHPTGEIKLMAGKGYRNPTMRELYMYKPANEELEPERMWNYEVSWRQRLMQGRLTYGVNVFYIKGDNMIQVVDMRNVNTGKIQNHGIELEGEYRINSHWRVNTNHSFLKMKNPIVASPKYKGFLGGAYKCNRWHIIANLQYINGLYTEVETKEEKENFLLFNASVNYAVRNNLSLWVRGENLLAQGYEITKGYPMPRATFMGGVNLSF